MPSEPERAFFDRIRDELDEDWASLIGRSSIDCNVPSLMCPKTIRVGPRFGNANGSSRMRTRRCRSS